jgi:hypothetical protein
MSSEVTVYVQLLDENVDVWVPVPATFEGNGRYRLSDEQPDGERWVFPPGSRVRCQRRSLADGEGDQLVARVLLEKVARQAGEVRVTIMAASRSGDVTTTELRLDSGEWPFEPVAPADLSNGEDQPVVELHKLVRLDGNTAVFESYDSPGVPPQPGGPYRMFSWWDPNQFRAATDTGVRWQRRTYDEPGGHTHCLLTFDVIDHGATAYQVDDQGWITVDARKKYICDDLLRLRGRQ